MNVNNILRPQLQYIKESNELAKIVTDHSYRSLASFPVFTYASSLILRPKSAFRALWSEYE